MATLTPAVGFSSRSAYTAAVVLGLAHAVADGAAGWLLGTLADQIDMATVATLFLVYNALGFAGQPVAGWVVDRIGRPRDAATFGILAIALGLAIGVEWAWFAVVLAGLGSAFFHVGGGAIAARVTPGRAAAPGLFAAPGVLGLAIGGLLATGEIDAGWALALTLAGIALAVAFVPVGLPLVREPAARHEQVVDTHDLVMIALLGAIALRSLVWTLVGLLGDGQGAMILALGLAAFAGKATGGFLADWLGWRTWITLSLAGSALLLTVGGGEPIAMMVGVGLLQSAAPATLAAVVQRMPRLPATASGLALGLAIAAGGLPTLLVSNASWPWMAPGVLLIVAAILSRPALARVRNRSGPTSSEINVGFDHSISKPTFEAAS